MSDPYQILGVSAEDGPAAWKRAYRRLAMRWHPDRCDAPDATERFKAIRAAYEQLLAVDTDSASESEPEEAPQPAQPRAADIRLNIEISLVEAFAGCRKNFQYHRGRPCVTCDGTGESGLSRTRFCQACHGSGRIHDASRQLIHCPECAGRGFFTERICPDCSGSGQQTSEVTLAVNIPAGMQSGDELRLQGQGEPGDDLLAPGNLYLTVLIQPHDHFVLSGCDLSYELPVNALQLLVGGEISLPWPLGAFSWALPAGEPARQTCRIPGKGLPARGQRPAGDLHVTLSPVFPVNLSARQQKILASLNAECLRDWETHFPDVPRWFE